MVILMEYSNIQKFEPLKHPLHLEIIPKLQYSYLDLELYRYFFLLFQLYLLLLCQLILQCYLNQQILFFQILKLVLPLYLIYQDFVYFLFLFQFSLHFYLVMELLQRFGCQFFLFFHLTKQPF